MNSNDNIMLSILVPTYGQEKYITQTLDSILMQKTHYTYEVLVGEDASPDGTKEILQQYEKKYPDKFQMIYREINMSKIKQSNAADLKRRARGKYIITLEGDDFWTDQNKLEKQIDFLEKNPEYIAVAHNCVVVDENSVPNGENYPECKENEYSLKHYANNIFPGQFATVMMRNYYKYKLFDTSILDKRLSPGDILIYFALITHGKIYCIQEKMSAYRHIIKGGKSYSANFKYDFEKQEFWHKNFLEYAYSLNNPQAEKCAETVYLSSLILAFRLKAISFFCIFKYTKKLKHRFIIWIYYFRRVFNKLFINKVKFKKSFK